MISLKFKSYVSCIQMSRTQILYELNFPVKVHDIILWTIKQQIAHPRSIYYYVTAIWVLLLLFYHASYLETVLRAWHSSSLHVFSFFFTINLILCELKYQAKEREKSLVIVATPFFLQHTRAAHALARMKCADVIKFLYSR